MQLKLKVTEQTGSSWAPTTPSVTLSQPVFLASVEAHLLPFPNVHLGATCESLHRRRKSLGSENVRGSGSGPAQGLVLVKVIFFLLPLLSTDHYTEEKWAIRKPKKPLRAWTRANSWSSSSIIHKKDLFLGVESRKIQFILQRSAKIFGRREDLPTCQSSLGDESRSLGCLTRLQWVCKCFHASVAMCEGTNPSPDIAKQNRWWPKQSQPRISGCFCTNKNMAAPPEALVNSLTCLPERSSPARLLRHLLIGALAAPQRWQDIKNLSSGWRRRFMSAHVNASVIYGLSQLLRRSLVRPCPSGASGRRIAAHSCSSAPSTRLRLGFSRKTVRVSDCRGECVVGSRSSTSETTR